MKDTEEEVVDTVSPEESPDLRTASCTFLYTPPVCELCLMCVSPHTHPLSLLLSVGQHLLKGSYRQRLLQHKDADGQIWRHILEQQEHS